MGVDAEEDYDPNDKGLRHHRRLREDPAGHRLQTPSTSKGWTSNNNNNNNGLFISTGSRRSREGLRNGNTVDTSQRSFFSGCRKLLRVKVFLPAMLVISFTSMIILLSVFSKEMLEQQGSFNGAISYLESKPGINNPNDKHQIPQPRSGGWSSSTSSSASSVQNRNHDNFQEEQQQRRRLNQSDDMTSKSSSLLSSSTTISSANNHHDSTINRVDKTISNNEKQNKDLVELEIKNAFEGKESTNEVREKKLPGIGNNRRPRHHSQGQPNDGHGPAKSHNTTATRASEFKAKLQNGTYSDHNQNATKGRHKHYVEKTKAPIDWQAVSLPQRRQRPQFPQDSVGAAYPLDPLGGQFDVWSLRRLNLTIDVQNLGVLLDGGRHYYPVDWIKRMIHVISMMQYNLLHFRLTDDQVFNVQLDSWPLLAYPSRLDGNTRVYQPQELREIVQFAKERGVTVIPEINVPGHAGAWGGMPELLVQCPKFICEKGYSVPLNVSNPLLRDVLKGVLTEVIDIFDNPPYLHLGGDEVDMSLPCLYEIGAEKFDYNIFEAMLREIIEEVGYDTSRVIRWEMMAFMEGLKRAGDITHFWFTQPGHTGTGVGLRWDRYYGDYKHPVFNSQGLYFDVNDHDSAHDIYVHSQQNTHLKHVHSPNLGIIAGTFELGVSHWVDRNVVGKLLAVAIGASHVDIHSEHELYAFYKEQCRHVGFRDDLCLLYADAPMDFGTFRQSLKNGRHKDVTWNRWIKDICDRFTTDKDKRVYSPPRLLRNAKNHYVSIGQASFWNSLDDEATIEVLDKDQPLDTRIIKASAFDGLPRLVEHTGISIGLSVDPHRVNRIEQIIKKTMRPMAFNLAQLRLVDDLSFAYLSRVFNNLLYTNLKDRSFPETIGLIDLRSKAAALGVAIMPELSLTTNSGGMRNSNFNVECAEYTCERGSKADRPWNIALPMDINDSNYLPIAHAIIYEVMSFASSPFLHLGSDERNTTTPCFEEALKESPNFGAFEKKLGRLLNLSNVTSSRIVRWENSERFHYPDRLGDITQCRPGDSVCAEKFGSSISPWMATVDIREGGPWKIFSTTRSLATMKNRPMGIVAELGGLSLEYFNQNDIDIRLLAFNLATIDSAAAPDDTSLSIDNEEDFMDQFPRLCAQTTGFEESKCLGFANQTQSSESFYDEQKYFIRWQQGLKIMTCTEFTGVVKEKVFRNGTIPTALSLAKVAINDNSTSSSIKPRIKQSIMKIDETD